MGITRYINPRKAFSARVFWSIIPMFLVLFSFVGLLSIKRQGELLQQQFMKRGLSMATSLARSAELGVYAESDALLDSATRGVATDADVAYVLIYDDQGRLLLKRGQLVEQTTPGDLSLAPELLHELTSTSQATPEAIAPTLMPSSEQFTDFVVPITTEPVLSPEQQLLGSMGTEPNKPRRTIGILQLALLNNSLTEQRIALMRLWGGITLAVIIIGTLAAYFVSRRVTQPINQLIAGAQRFASGQLDERISTTALDEIGQLASTFNEMAASIESYIAAKQESIQEAQAASKAKSAFLATMSHEIRTPMNGLLGMIDLLGKGQLDHSQQRYVTIAKASAQTLLNIISDILDLSKIEAGKLELESVSFDLWKAVEDCVQGFSFHAYRKGIDLACHIAHDVPLMVRCDPTRLKQVLNNLINNALKFTSSGQIIVRVTLRQDLGHEAVIALDVHDSGIGIDSDKIDRLFRSFSQVDNSTTRKYGGTGLGLTISKNLVQMMGGQIGVDSQPGVGSTFSFTVHVIKHHDPAQEIARRRSQSHLKQVHCLIVHRNQAVRQVLQDQLANAAVTVACAADSDEALTLLRNDVRWASAPAAALIDQSLSPHGGLALAKAIQVAPTLNHIAVIMLNPMDQPIHEKRLQSAGVAACLSQPVAHFDLYDTLANVLNLGVEPSADHPDDDAQPPPPHATAPPAGARILIAEDNEINQIVIGKLLGAEGYEYQFVDNGAQAVQAVQKNDYHLVLMDCQMPEMDGFEATRRIRQLEQAGQLASPSGQRLPIIALTANALKGDKQRCLDAGMDGYQTKPLNAEQLIHAVQKYMILPQKTDNNPTNQPLSTKT